MGASSARRARNAEIRKQSGYYRGAFRAMGSPCELLVDTDDENLACHLLDIVAAEAWRIEDKFSRYLPNNVVAKINSANGTPVIVDDETANLIDFAVMLYELSDKHFDISSGVLRKVWQFDGSENVPLACDVAAIMSVVGWHHVCWQRPRIVLQPGMQIDFGGIGKEYAADRAATSLANESSCACLVNFGGDLVVVGESRTHTGWQVGIEQPDSGGAKAQKLIRLRQGALATSGDARRYVINAGKRYSHILDALTGWPVEDAPRSITVAASTCTQAGMLATLAMLRGANAEAFLEAQDVQFWCLR